MVATVPLIFAANKDSQRAAAMRTRDCARSIAITIWPEKYHICCSQLRFLWRANVNGNKPDAASRPRDWHQKAF
jgi:hypothetical protein